MNGYTLTNIRCDACLRCAQFSDPASDCYMRSSGLFPCSQHFPRHHDTFDRGRSTSGPVPRQHRGPRPPGVTFAPEPAPSAG